MLWQAIKSDLSLDVALQHWPTGKPLLVFGGTGSRYVIAAFKYKEIAAAEFLQQPVYHPRYELSLALRAKADGVPFCGGYMGFLSYDDFSVATDRTARLSRSRIFRIDSALLIDQEKQTSYAVGIDRSELLAWLDTIKAGSQGTASSAPQAFNCGTWRPEQSRSAYLAKVRRCLEDIRSGRYYQINLLRYFELIGVAPERDAWLQRWQQHSGPFGSILWQSDFRLVSCSPERFLSFARSPESGRIELVSQPIKGTMAVSQNPDEDRQQQFKLAASAKDAAELNMIVDLIRNDMYRVSRRHSVQVENPGEIQSFQHVHHRVAPIRSHLIETLSMHDLLQALCPGGSITGAPKHEVMQAIFEYEERRRGFFMGQAFYWDPVLSTFDSSILIRTAYQQQQQAWQFAAGSGLVVASQPELEFNEINDKCKVFFDKACDP